MDLHEAITRANIAGRLGLIVYTIPGYPTPESCEKVIDILDGDPRVSILETTLPVTSMFSDHANEVIRRAHRIASAHWTVGTVQDRPHSTKPRLIVLYRESVEQLGVDACLRHLQGTASGLILEWEEREKNAFFREACGRIGLELVECIGPWMPEDEVKDLLEETREQPLVYLMSADRTGGRLFAHAEIESCVRTIRRHRPAAKVAAGFGISTPDHIRTLKQVQGVDAVIVGTACLRAMANGVAAACSFLAEMAAAL